VTTMRFKFRDKPIHMRDCERDPDNEVDDQAPQQHSLTAVFAPGHTAREHSDGVTIHDSSGEKVASIHNSPHVAVGSEGELRVYHKRAERAAEAVAHATSTDAALRAHETHRQRLRGINEQHAQHFRRIS